MKERPKGVDLEELRVWKSEVERQLSVVGRIAVEPMAHRLSKSETLPMKVMHYTHYREDIALKQIISIPSIELSC